MKDIIIQPEVKMELRQCICGKYPHFVQPNFYYSDMWLECECGRYTKNTGGFLYAHEISENEAREAAIKLWNKEDIMEKYT